MWRVLKLNFLLRPASNIFTTGFDPGETALSSGDEFYSEDFRPVCHGPASPWCRSSESHYSLLQVFNLIPRK